MVAARARSVFLILALVVVGCGGKDVAGFPGAASSADPTAQGTPGAETGGDGSSGSGAADSSTGDPGDDTGGSASSSGAAESTGVACEDVDADGICDDDDQCASLQFTGNDGWLESPPDPFPNAALVQGTISLWFRTTVTDATFFSGEGYLQVAVEGGHLLGCSDGVCTSAVSGGVVNDGRWHHAAITWDANHTGLYLDGAFQQSIIPVQTPQVENTERSFVLGKHANTGIASTLDGQIAETAMWNEILTVDEIADLRDGVMLHPPQLLWWPISEGTGVAAGDETPNDLHGLLNNGATWSGDCPWADADRDGTVAHTDPDDADASVP